MSTDEVKILHDCCLLAHILTLLLFPKYMALKVFWLSSENYLVEVMFSIDTVLWL